MSLLDRENHIHNVGRLLPVLETFALDIESGQPSVSTAFTAASWS
jgi:hypothetical protein